MSVCPENDATPADKPFMELTEPELYERFLSRWVYDPLEDGWVQAFEDLPIRGLIWTDECGGFSAQIAVTDWEGDNRIFCESEETLAEAQRTAWVYFKQILLAYSLGLV